MSDAQVDGGDQFQQIAAKLRDGDESGLEEVLRELGPSLAARLRNRFSILLTTEDIDDVLSQMLFRLWEHRMDYREDLAPFSAWCYLIARNIALDEVRNKLRRNSVLHELWKELRPVLMPSDPVQAGPIVDAMRQSLATMPPDDREILFASVSGEDAWAANLAARLGRSSNSIRQKRFRALSKLREELARLGFFPFAELKKITDASDEV